MKLLLLIGALLISAAPVQADEVLAEKIHGNSGILLSFRRNVECMFYIGCFSFYDYWFFVNL